MHRVQRRVPLKMPSTNNLHCLDGFVRSRSAAHNYSVSMRYLSLNCYNHILICSKTFEQPNMRKARATKYRYNCCDKYAYQRSEIEATRHPMTKWNVIFKQIK
jgi:hypothetical protein